MNVRVSLLAAATLCAALLGTAQAQTSTPPKPTPTPSITPTPNGTPQPGGRKLPRLLLKNANGNSPDGNGSGIDAKMRLSKDGVWDGSTLELVVAQQTVDDVKARNGQIQVTFTINKLKDGEYDSNVYVHTEKGAPYCVFGDDRGVCRSLRPNGETYRWPTSDEGTSPDTNGGVIEPGEYSIQVSAFAHNADDTGTFGNWNSDDIRVTIEPALVAEAPLPPLSGRAAIVAPSQRAVFAGVVQIRGTASSNNFGLYKFELVDARCAEGVCFMIDFKQPVANGTLWRWDTRQPLPNGAVLSNGDYVMQLSVLDKWGRVLSSKPRLAFTIRN